MQAHPTGEACTITHEKVRAARGVLRPEQGGGDISVLRCTLRGAQARAKAFGFRQGPDEWSRVTDGIVRSSSSLTFCPIQCAGTVPAPSLPPPDLSGGKLVSMMNSTETQETAVRLILNAVSLVQLTCYTFDSDIVTEALEWTGNKGIETQVFADRNHTCSGSRRAMARRLQQLVGHE